MMIELCRFEDCYKLRMREFIKAENEFLTRKQALIQACQGLVCHPESQDKESMLLIIRELETGNCP